MSIIYEALQKTQQKKGAKESDFRIKSNELESGLDLGLALIIAILLGLLIIAHYPKKNSTRLPQAVPGKIQINKSQEIKRLNFSDFKNKHILTGVFISHDEKIAVINNQFFNLGDEVDGMTITHIEAGAVKLKNKLGSLELKIKV